MSKKHRQDSHKFRRNKDEKELQPKCAKTGNFDGDPVNRREFLKIAAMSSVGLSMPLLYSCDDSGTNQNLGGIGGTAGSGGGLPASSGVSGVQPVTGGTTLMGSGGSQPATGGTTSAGSGGIGGVQSATGGTTPAGSGGEPPGSGGTPQGGSGGQAGADGGQSGGGGSGGGPGPQPVGGSDVILARYDAQQAATGEAAVRLALTEMDFSWLSVGDSVFIKVACNSGNQHPAVTSPQAIRGMVAELLQRGAGRVIVGDKAGVEWVWRNDLDQRGSATRNLFQSNGLLAAAEQSGAETYFFDDQEFAAGYFQATPPPSNNWPRGLWVPNIIREVDHIIYMPRLGFHMLAGCTLGLKMAVGWLRDDSRHDMHQDAAAFYAKYTEVNFVNEIKDRYRMTVSLSEALLLHNGPDDGTVFPVQPPIVIASTSIANHDAVASSVLSHYAEANPGMGYDPGGAPLLNSAFAGIIWPSAHSTAPASSYVGHNFQAALSQDGAVTRAWELTGGRPSSIRVVVRGQELEPALQTFMESHGEGIYSFTT